MPELQNSVFGALFCYLGNLLLLWPTTSARPQPTNCLSSASLKAAPSWILQCSCILHRQSYQKVMTTLLLQNNLLLRATCYFCLFLQTVLHLGVSEKQLAGKEVLNCWSPKPLEGTAQFVFSDNALLCHCKLLFLFLFNVIQFWSKRKMKTEHSRKVMIKIMTVNSQIKVKSYSIK